MKISLSFRTSICGEAAEVIVVDQNLSRCCSRASNPPDVADGCETDPAGHQPICPLYTQVRLLFFVYRIEIRDVNLIKSPPAEFGGRGIQNKVILLYKLWKEIDRGVGC